MTYLVDATVVEYHFVDGSKWYVCARGYRDEFVKTMNDTIDENAMVGESGIVRFSDSRGDHYINFANVTRIRVLPGLEAESMMKQWMVSQ